MERAFFGTWALLVLQPVLSFWGEKSISSVCCSEPTTGRHAEDVGVTVKCSFPPTNTCIHLTHSYYTAFFFFSVCTGTVWLRKAWCDANHLKRSAQNLHTFSGSPSVLTRLCVHVFSISMIMRNASFNKNTLRPELWQWAVLPVFFFFLFYSAFAHIDFCRKAGLLTGAMQLSDSHWIIRQRLETHKPHVFTLFFSFGLIAVSLSTELSISSTLMKN